MVSGKAVEVTISNVPSFLFAEDVAVDVDGKEIHAAVSFGGAFFALVDASQLGVKLTASDVRDLIPFTAKMLARINEKIDAVHPELDITRVVNAEYYLSEGPLKQRNIVIAEEGQVDRSPCGTGTSAKLAYLYKTGKMKPGDVFINENFTSAVFKGEILDAVEIGGYEAIHPMITGSAYIDGFSTWVIDEDDPVKYGFVI